MAVRGTAQPWPPVAKVGACSSGAGVTITAAELADAAQLLPGVQASRLLRVVTVMVEKYAPGAPSDIQNEAVIRVAGWLAHTAAGSLARVETGPRITEYAVGQKGALRHSGAMSLLSPYKIRRGGVI